MRQRYLRCPTSNRCTMPVYYCWPYSKYPTLYIRMVFSEYPISNSRLTYSKCPAPYKCALLRIDTIRGQAPYKTLFRSVQKDRLMKSFTEMQNLCDHFVNICDHKWGLEHLYHRDWIRWFCLLCKLLLMTSHSFHQTFC